MKATFAIILFLSAMGTALVKAENLDDLQKLGN